MEISIKYYEPKITNNMKVKEIRKFISSTADGVALIDMDENEKIYRKKNIEDLICLLSNKKIKNINYIDDELNIFIKIGMRITLDTDEYMIIEAL